MFALGFGDVRDRRTLSLLEIIADCPHGKSSNCTRGGPGRQKRDTKKVRVDPHVPARLATTAATSMGRKAEAVRKQKVSHSLQRQPTVGKVGKEKRKASQSLTIAKCRHPSTPTWPVQLVGGGPHESGSFLPWR